ncbi:hypothetical protein [Thalassotalea mangrovi]|uniref:Uncharacterized protein n=1 Tax=Thalassotalea mangrovi TaxID=2572245 RepID=A0A4U1B807_9GAMM|nr:hypothetical protein [Thalassotalea mangrovi]TKB46063.1 hypothetical protein E8M12_05390 [Thalassotalea mangrovi]
MISLSYFFFAILLCQLFLLATTFKIEDATWRLWWLRILLFGVIYDNAILLCSSLTGATPGLEFYSELRWLFHAMILPVLGLFSLSIITQVNPNLKWRNGFYFMFSGLVLAGIGYGLWGEYIHQQLVPATFSDPNQMIAPFERFVAEYSSPPWATIGMNVVAILCSIYVWIKGKWPWFSLGAISIFLVNGAAAGSDYGFMLGNIMEVLFIASLIATERFVQNVGIAAAGDVAEVV